ncbi:PilZ domain-containing protein [Sphingomonas sp. MMS24-JH45]
MRVRNISAGGLMAEVPEPITPENSAIRIEVRGIGWVSGRVAWQTEGRIGIAFDQEIDPRRARKPVTGSNT